MMQQSSGGIFGNMPPIVKNLIIINALMLLATLLFHDFMIDNFALSFPASPLFKPIQIFTHMFMHGGFFHLFFNMYAVFIFGSVLEKVWGPKRFLIYYLVTGLGAALLHLLVIWIQLYNIESSMDPALLTEVGNKLDHDTALYMRHARRGFSGAQEWSGIMISYTVGASGAVFGILLAFGMLFPNTVLQLLFPPIALKAKWFVIIYGVIELVLGFTDSVTNIAHFAHIGGMLFGYFLIIYWRKQRNNFY